MLDTIILTYFIFETIHFAAGFIRCLIFPEIVINAYTLQPSSPTCIKSLEMVKVLKSFYLLLLILSAYTAGHLSIAFPSLLVLAIFYWSLLIQDIYDFVTEGFQWNKRNKYIYSAIHLVLGIVSFILCVLVKIY